MKPFSLLFILAASILSGGSFGQSFQISHVPAEYFSLDKFANEVYYIEFGHLNIFIKNLKDSTVRPCPFPTLPVFANKSHKCVYGNEDSIFVYDFETQKTVKICESVGGPYSVLEYEFTPNDEYVLFRNHYYSFFDSTLHQIDFTPDPYWQMEWVNETEFIWSFTGDLLASFDILENKLDTILVSSSYLNFAAFAYNKSTNLLYYAMSESVYPKIHSYDLSSHIDSVVIDTENDTTDNCWATYNNLQEMEWSPDSSRMAFFSYILDAGGTIYTYSPADRRLFKYTNCGGEGYEYHLKWLNNDTIVYFNATWGFIYGLALDHPLGVENAGVSTLPVSMELSQNFPNPFNPLTTINYQLPHPGLVTLKVYDILGKEVALLVNEEKSAGSYSVDFDASKLASGVYIYQLRANEYLSSKKMLLLK